MNGKIVRRWTIPVWVLCVSLFGSLGSYAVYSGYLHEVRIAIGLAILWGATLGASAFVRSVPRGLYVPIYNATMVATSVVGSFLGVGFLAIGLSDYLAFVPTTRFASIQLDVLVAYWFWSAGAFGIACAGTLVFVMFRKRFVRFEIQKLPVSSDNPPVDDVRVMEQDKREIEQNEREKRQNRRDATTDQGGGDDG